MQLSAWKKWQWPFEEESGKNVSRELKTYERVKQDWKLGPVKLITPRCKPSKNVPCSKILGFYEDEGNNNNNNNTYKTYIAHI